MSAKEASPPGEGRGELRKMESFVAFLSAKKTRGRFNSSFCALFVLSSDKKNQDLEISKVNLSMFRFHHENSTLAL